MLLQQQPKVPYRRTQILILEEEGKRHRQAEEKVVNCFTKSHFQTHVRLLSFQFSTLKRDCEILSLARQIIFIKACDFKRVNNLRCQLKAKQSIK